MKQSQAHTRLSATHQFASEIAETRHIPPLEYAPHPAPVLGAILVSVAGAKRTIRITPAMPHGVSGSITLETHTRALRLALESMAPDLELAIDHIPDPIAARFRFQIRRAS